MTTHMQHPDWDTLNDFADGSIAPRTHADVVAHVDACAMCRDTVARLRALVDSASSLPQSVEPPAEAWTAIAAKIDDAKVVELSSGAHGATDATGRETTERRVARNRRFMLAAAAVVLIAASSGVTAMLMQRGNDTGVVATTPGNQPIEQLASLPAEMATVERTYLATVEELIAVLNDTRSGLSPETVRAVRRSLTVIDEAITEAREALISDPASEVLREMLARNYQQKVDLLQRVSLHAGMS